MKNEKLDLIAVTKGPGLEPCLWVGINFAKDLSEKMNIPLVPTNHIESHILANFLNTKYQIPRRRNSVSLRGRLNTKYLFPAVCLVVSGGHTQLILMRDFGKYQILGETRDDAAGECFDKVARILGLGYPGGPAIAAEAARYKIQDTRYKAFLPRPMMYQKNYDFSFSGLKTAVLYDFQSRSQKIRKSKEYIQVMAKEVQQTIIDVLIHKTLKAAKNLKAESIILGGGVTANDELRKQLRSKVKSQMPNVKLFVPPRSLCTDNAVMAAVTAYYRWLKRAGENWHNIEADANLRLE